MEEVTETVFEQYQEVQQSGEVNMVYKSRVRDVACRKGLDELVRFIDENNYYVILENYNTLDEKYGQN